MFPENSNKLDSNRSRSEDASDRSEKTEKNESKHSNIPENEHQHSIEKDHDDEEHTERSEQQDLYEKTLKSASIEKRSRASSMHSNRPNSPAVSRSTNFESKPAKKKSNVNLSLISIKDPYLTTINDMKYLGDQFLVGKLNPNLKSPFESRFEKRYTRTLNKLKASTDKTDSNEILSEYKRNANANVKLDPQFTLTNELKFTGKQFNVGKMDPKLKSPFEKKFQERFKSHLKVLAPNSKRMVPNLQFDDLKRIHNSLAIPRTINSK